MINNFIIPLDYIFLAIGAIVIVFCFWRGVTASILGLLTWLGSIIITIYFYKDLSDFLDSQLLNIDILRNYEQITNILSIIISIPLIFLISLFIIKKIKRVISSDIDRQIFGVLVDKLLGFLFGFILNYVIFSTILYLTNNFELFNFLNLWLLDNSYLISELESFNNNMLSSFTGIEKEDAN